MAVNQIQTGIQNNGDGSLVNARAGKQGETIVSELHPRLYETNYRGNVFSLPLITAAAVTAYSGAAAGTPMIAVYNPIGSSKNLVVLSAAYANAVAASAAGTVVFGLYAGVQTTVPISATANAAPVKMSTMTQSGSVALGYTNTALTGGVAATAFIPLGSYYWATAAGAALVTSAAPAAIDGQLIIPPGGYVALGGNAALTSATWNGALIWEEVPV